MNGTLALNPNLLTPMTLGCSGMWSEMTCGELQSVDGGAISAAGIVCGVFTTIGGICTVAAGVALVVIPEPSVTKISAAWSISAGISTIGAGVSGIFWACGY